MYFLFSGEGPTDLGSGRSGLEIHEHLAGHFEPGPLAHLVDQMVEDAQGFSPLETLHCGFVSETSLSRRKDELNPAKKSVVLPGAKRRKETGYFYNNARILARIARKQASKLNTNVVAVLFRDADGTASGSRGEWDAKHQSMLNGFAAEDCVSAVPMLANPKSEAWLLCALQDNPYQDCQKWEQASGNDQSPNALKPILELRLGLPVSRERLCELVANRTINHAKINMPSFNAFRRELHRVIPPALGS